ncbi:MAG: hypothetical protein IJD10_01710 [Clostridia bacterium]|nr:hypothetical protein [Clostridia bacterium]
MMKKLLFSVFLAVSLYAIFSLSVSAAPASAPGGTVTSYDELKAALGGDEVVKSEDGYLLMLSDIRLEAPVVIRSGEYVLRGAGIVITASFDKGSFFEIESGDKTALHLGSLAETGSNDSLTLDGEGKTREGSLVLIDEGATLSLYAGTVLKDNVTSVTGGAVSCFGSLIMYGGSIEGCRSLGAGGAIYAKGQLILASGIISGCSGEFGGALYNEGTASLAGTEMRECTASKGGAVFNALTLALYSSSISDCSAKQGGCLYNSGESTLEGGQILTCKAENGEGGGIYNTGTLNMKGTYINECAANKGGNLFNEGKAELSDGQVNRGTADLHGGGVFNAEKAQFTMSGGTLGGGKATYGGCLYNVGTVFLMEGLIVNGKADVGAGALNEGTLCLSDGILVDKKNPIAIVITEDNAHAAQINAPLRPERVASLEPVVRVGDAYRIEYQEGFVLVGGKAMATEIHRFTVAAENGAEWLISASGALKSPVPLYHRWWFYLILVAAFAVTVTALTFAIRCYDKKAARRSA